MSRIRPPDCPKLAKNSKNDNDVTIFQHDVKVNFFDVCLFLLSNLVTGLSLMSISSLVLELWRFSFMRVDQKSGNRKYPSEICSISGACGKIWIPNLARMSLIKCYWMLQNSRVTAFTVFELLLENQLGGGGVKLPTPPRLKLKVRSSHWSYSVKIGVLKHFANFTEKHLCWSFFLTESSG